MRLYIDFNAYRQEALLKQENIPIQVLGFDLGL